MLFDFFKRLFWKADEGQRKRKASDGVIGNDDQMHSKKRCHNLVSSNQVNITESGNPYMEGAKTDLHYSSRSSQNIMKSDSSASCLKNGSLLESPVQWSKMKSNFMEDDKCIFDKNNLSIPKCSAVNQSPTICEAHRLAQKKQYSEMLLSFLPTEKQTVDMKFNNRINKGFNINELNLQKNENQSKVTYNSNHSLKVSGYSFKPWFILNTPTENTNEYINDTNFVKVDMNQHNLNESSCRMPIEIIKTNTLRDQLSNKQVIKQDFITQISRKYNERIEKRNKEAEELKKMTYVLSKHNQVTREAALEDHLNRSMRLCEDILDERDLDQESKLPVLSSDMMERIKFAFSHQGTPDEILVQGFGLRITRKDIQTLAGLNWLNDEIINFYMNLLITRGNNEKYPNVYAMNTFFYPKLISGGHTSLKRWTRKVDIFAKDLLVVPIHLGMHWCMSIIDFRNKSIRYYDSMGISNYKCLQVLKEYLYEESMDKKKKSFDFSDWSFECLKDIPQQMNGSDCGVFSCMFAEYISANKTLNFSQSDMPYFRKKMVYEILTIQLL